MAQPSYDEEIRLVKRQLTQLMRALEQLPQHCRELSGHPTGMCVDSYLTETELVYKIDLAGVPEAELEILVNRNRLLIKGNRPRPTHSTDQSYIIAERPFGPFKRELDLPTPVNSTQVQATLKNGLLTIRLPRIVERRGQDQKVPVECLDE